MGGYQSLQPCFQRDISLYSLEEFGGGMYKTKNVQAKIFLMRKLMNLKIKDGQLIVEHLNDFERMIAQLSIVGLSLEEKT